MQKKTWESKGIEYASELVLQNTRDLVSILDWNIDRGISFYRCSSGLFPWNSQYEIEDLPDWNQIHRNLEKAGEIILENGIRFSFHPSHWCKLGSQTDGVVENSVKDLNNHGKWMDAMGLPRTHMYPINIHIGGFYDGKEPTANRFLEEWERLHPGAKERLTVENDDKPNLWSISDLVEYLGGDIPITFDYHHHQFSSERPYKEAFKDSKGTWDVKPVTHYSEPACLWGIDKRPQAHSDYISGIPRWMFEQSDVMIEAKKKEKALLTLASS